ncbi:MAG: OmpW family outer membrane protein [Candidatus Aminicenantales bacterium]
MQKRLVIGCAIFLLTGTAFAASISIQMKASYFLPSDEYFKSIYGNAPTYGAKIGFDIWKSIGIWLDAEFYSKTGKTTLMSEETKLQLIPITAGVRYMFLPDKNFSPYLGAGIGYFQYKETNPIGSVSKGDVGFIIQGGFVFKLNRMIFVDVQGSYSSCKANPSGVEAELGGIKVGLGLGISL